MTEVSRRISDLGSWYKKEKKELGPFTIKDEREADFDKKLAQQLAATAEDIQKARQDDINRPITDRELAEILDTTIRQDYETKSITLKAGILTFTKQDQVNLIMSGEAAGGKSYISLEVASFFPEDVVMIVGTSSPTAFFHDFGQWDQERKLRVIDLSRKIIILTDQPHPLLLQKLRALLSHDIKELLYKVTDRSKSGAHRTKNVLIIGFPTFIFCSAKTILEDQELTRAFILSPETSREKLDESLRLLAAKVGHRAAFAEWISNHPRRLWLKQRIQNIRNAMLEDVIIEDEEAVYKRFVAQHPHLAPRHQRDLPRIFALIKANALLNFSHRKRPEGNDRCIIATREDIDSAFTLYGMVAESNELGLAPEVFQIYRDIIRPLLLERQMATRQQILGAYYHAYGRFLNEQKLRREILPALEARGLITQEPDPADKRRMLVSLSDVAQENIVVSTVIHTEGNSTTPQTSIPAVITPQTTISHSQPVSVAENQGENHD
jgi:hypothetical protein